MPIKVAVCFWGLTRNALHITLPSIRDNIYNPMERAGVLYDIFLHTYRKDAVYSNQYAKESDIALDPEEWRLLKPHFSSIESEEDIGGEKGICFEEYHSKLNTPNTNIETANNVIKSVWSKQQVSRMVRSKGGYDYVMFVRPDCKFYTPISMRWFIQDAIVFPRFHCFPVNDRFMILPAEHIDVMATCFDRFLDYSKKHTVHSESYLASLVYDISIRKVCVDFLFNRIRADGREEDDCLIDHLSRLSVFSITSSLAAARPSGR